MRCPGHNTRFRTSGDVTELSCDHCGRSIEFFKDDGIRRCPGCGKRVLNPKVGIGCEQRGAPARDCLGYDPTDGQGNTESDASLADPLIEAMKTQFGSDNKRITHALSVLDLAEQILRQENADPRVVIAAAVLHDIGIQEAERKHGSSAGRYQEIEGPPIAEHILRDMRFDEATVRHVSQIVGHHHRGGLDTVEFSIIWDADNLVNAREERSESDLAETLKHLTRILKTDSGKLLAERLFGPRSVDPASSRPPQRHIT